MQINIYDIPVYSTTEDEYNLQLQKFLSNSFLQKNQNFYEENPTCAAQARHTLLEEFGGCWRYNRIIGYIRLYILGTQIRGEYYQARKPKKKLFKYITHKLADEVELPFKLQNEDIFKEIMSYLAKCSIILNKRSKNRKYIDSSLFESLGPHVDWKKLMLG